MSDRTDWSRLVGYADRLSARPGERLRVMVSGEREASARVVSLPGREAAEGARVESLAPVRPQPVVTGSYVVVDQAPALRPGDGLVVSTWLWLAPGAPASGRAELIATDGYALVLDGLRPRFEVSGAGVDAADEIERGEWVSIEGALDPAAHTIAITVAGTTTTVTAADTAALQDGGPLVIGAGFDGKLDQPRVGEHDLQGRSVNGPLRAVTGHNWNGDVHDWRHAPDQYGAMHFHTDAVDDLAWEPSFEIALDESLEPGVYALELSDGEVEDLVAFAVRSTAAEPPATAVLLPTFTYLAYSCELATPAAVSSSESEDRWAAEHGLRSLYDRYVDGVGVYEASLWRPLSGMRPGYRCPQHGGPHGLAQELILLDWLRRRGIDFDVITDHDLHAEGAQALAGRHTVITGAHPEYATEAMLEALDEHLRGGGNLAYLGGNGLNGSVSVDPDRPQVIELRRTETQGLVWQALPGEHHHASGQYGGDWRRRGWPEHRMLGVGLRAWGEGAAVGYHRPDGPEDPAAAIVFAGVKPGEAIDGDGVVQGGAAGYEVDAFDPRAGSPADAVVLASAEMGPGYVLWPDDVIDDPSPPPPLRADMTLIRRPEGGAVFSVGSIAWTGCLVDDENAVSRVTANVLAELSKPEPFASRGQTP